MVPVDASEKERRKEEITEDDRATRGHVVMRHVILKKDTKLPSQTT